MRSDRRVDRAGSGRRAPRALPGWRPILVSAVAGVLLLRAPPAGAASFEPGTEADPPTGTVPAAPVPSVTDGIRWEFAPLAYSGNVSLDGRWQSQEGGLRSRQGLMVGDIEFATYIWQPWFVQLRFGLGAVLARDVTGEAGGPSRSSSNPSTTGRLNLSVFPMSRFPFELRVEQGDSRVRGDAVGTDYRTQRLTLSQAYTPETGNTHLNLLLDHGRRTTADGDDDAVTNLSATASHQWEQHVLNLSAQHVVSRNSLSDSNNRNSALSLHHNYNPSPSLQTDSLASWNRSVFSAGEDLAAFDASTDIRQVSTFASWRPAEGQWFHSADAPVSITGSARLVETRQGGSGDTSAQRAMNLALGASKDLTPAVRLSGSASTSLIQTDGLADSQFTSATLGAAWAPPAVPVGEWRYAPSLGGNVGASQSTRDGSRQSLGAQVAHSVSRPISLGDNDSVSLAFSQSLAASHETAQSEWTQQLVHSGNLSWQAYSGEATQSYASFSLSDSRNMGATGGSFQLANLQVSRRTQLSRDASWSGNLTLQTSRNQDSRQSGTSVNADGPLVGSSNAQRFYSGSLTYENRRIFGVPRLRFTATLSLNSQQLDNRSPADIDAPRERITKSIEGRFDYVIGKLDTHLTTRWVEADGRGNASVFFRIQRHF